MFLKIAARTVAVLLVLAVSLVLYILFGDLSVHKDRILNAASDATGFYIASTGPFGLDVGRNITLSASGISIANPAWPDEHALATADSLELVVDARSILSGPIEVNSIAISGARVKLRSAADGRANWMPAAEPAKQAGAETSGPAPLIHLIEVDDVRISHEEADAMLFNSETTALRMRRTGHNLYEFELDETLDQVAITARGSMLFATGSSGVTNARIEFDEASLSVTGPTEANASFSGYAAADLSTDKPTVVADIRMSQMNMTTSGGDQAPAEQQNEDDAALLFDTTPLAFSWLDSLNLDAKLSIASANLDGNVLDDLQLTTNIQGAALTIAPVEFILGQGTFEGSLSLAPVNDDYALDVAVNVDKIRLAQMADADQDPATVPPLNARLSLAGQGASLHDIMASSSGKLTARQDSGLLTLQAMGALFSDFLTSIVRTLNPLAEERTYSNLECGIVDVSIVNGIATIEELALQSDRLTIVSSGNIDFETEALDLTLNTKSREGLGVSVGDVANSFIKLGGTLKDPALGVDAVGSVTTTGAAVATGGLSLLAKGLWDRVSSEVDICAQADEASD